jgi:hypothetical protein
MVVPQGIAVELGSLSVPSEDHGPKSTWVYTTYRRLVYAYSLGGVGCLSTLPSAQVSHRACTEWTFLDAGSGLHLLTTWVPNNA